MSNFIRLVISKMRNYIDELLGEFDDRLFVRECALVEHFDGHLDFVVALIEGLVVALMHGAEGALAEHFAPLKLIQIDESQVGHVDFVQAVAAIRVVVVKIGRKKLVLVLAFNSFHLEFVLPAGGKHNEHEHQGGQDHTEQQHSNLELIGQHSSIEHKLVETI